MVGRGSRKDEGSFTISNSNVFAALESLKKKKRSDKEKGAKGALKGDGAGKLKEIAEEKQVYWAPAPLTVKAWADVDDEDDDDYYATTAPPQTIWGGSASDKAEELHKPAISEESESEDELLDEGDEDVEDEHEHEIDFHQETMPVVKEPVELPAAPKEAERQLSKKERRKKELAELEAILADFRVNSKEKAEEEQPEVSKDRMDQLNEDEDKRDSTVTDSKTSKKKKKKEKASKEDKERQDQTNNSAAPDEQEETTENNESSSIVVKEKLKIAARKKKSNKEMDSAARAAAQEAAARSAKLAAAKKKEKNHYNQQPTR